MEPLKENQLAFSSPVLIHSLPEPGLLRSDADLCSKPLTPTSQESIHSADGSLTKTVSSLAVSLEDIEVGLAAPAPAADVEKVLRILTIDGGGIRGIIPTMVLKRIEEKTGQPISSLFHIIAGTSIGGITALGLATPADPSLPNETGKRKSTSDSPSSVDSLAEQPNKFYATDLLDMYESCANKIFDASCCGCGGFTKPRYKVEKLEGLLKEKFGDTRLSEALIDTVVTAHDMERDRTYLFNNISTDQEYPLNQHLLMRDLARGTSAAPSYFPPAKIYTSPKIKKSFMQRIRGVKSEKLHLLDGGLTANNPTLDVLTLARRYYPDVKRVLVVSLGTGKKQQSLDYDKMKDASSLKWLNPILNICMDGRSELTHESVETVLKTPEGSRQYYRFQPTLDSSHSAMDDFSSENIHYLKAITLNYLHENAESLEALLKQLKAPKAVLQKAKATAS